VESFEIVLRAVLLPLHGCLCAAGAYLAQTATEEGFKLVVTAQFWVPAVDTKGFLTVSLPELELTQQQELAFSGGRLNASQLNRVEVKSEFAVDKASVQLWWPAGGNYGPHKLYDVDISFSPDGSKCSKTDAAASKPLEAEKPSSAEPVIEQQPRADQTNSVVRAAAYDVDMAEPSTPEEAAAALDFADVDQLEAQQLQEKGRRRSTAATSTQQRHLLAENVVQQLGAAFTSAKAQPAGSAAPADQSKGAAAAAALSDLLGVIGNKLKDRVAADGAVRGVGSQCSSIKKRIGFRTVELVMSPLPQAVQDLFGSKKGFDFAIPPQKVHAILARDGAGQWANNADGEWSHFPGDNIQVRLCSMPRMPQYLKWLCMPTPVSWDSMLHHLSGACHDRQAE